MPTSPARIAAEHDRRWLQETGLQVQSRVQALVQVLQSRSRLPPSKRQLQEQRLSQRRRCALLWPLARAV